MRSDRNQELSFPTVHSQLLKSLSIRFPQFREVKIRISIFITHIFSVIHFPQTALDKHNRYRYYEYENKDMHIPMNLELSVDPPY